MANGIEELRKTYKSRKGEIRARLAEFESVRDSSDKRIFAELCFCILTANANALLCDKAIRELNAAGLLHKGSEHEIKKILRGKARFHNKKARYICLAREAYSRLNVRKMLFRGDAVQIRDRLVEHIKGFGYKEASHFLRNVGLGRDIAILDRHILKNLRLYGVIAPLAPSVGNRRLYLAIEDRMRSFCKRVRIPLGEMDLLLWSMETGFIFK